MMIGPTDTQALDGNAIAGDLWEAFGQEMTMIQGVCRRCRSVHRIAELLVYGRGPGTVVRCPTCGTVVFVVVSRAEPIVYLTGLELVGLRPGR